MGSYDSEIAYEVPPYLRVYKDGTVERFVGNGVTPAGFDPVTGVSSKDVVAIPETGVIARLYRPASLTEKTQKLPLVIYFHAGAFCISSAFDPKCQTTLNLLASKANIIAVSVNYRKVPEAPLPAAYEDSWAVIQWVFSHNLGEGCEEWLRENVDFSKVILAGDSAGANIAHHMAIRAGISHRKCGIKFRGIIIRHPYFWGEESIGVEAKDPVKKAMVDKWWKFACPSDKGCDDPLINPFLDEKFGEALDCDRVIVFVAENDVLVERGRRYYELLVKSRWQGTAEMVETPGEDHVFHLFHPNTEKARSVTKRCVAFINQIQ
ncbi:OLC1v1017522C1 [Oldenlandia corymbosa var. corymbosa]|uniref:OLC1v1017522C1 n=1 Tax=Oldenlandia corymbosa var. corymbosa TaxID=529605 RepID=A0AAV1E9L9_OLDCO|nr:OLC1v1017522C1 [Oldenlandia corymbosa var. corymbosa]